VKKYSKYIYFAVGIAGALLVYNLVFKKKNEQEESVPGKLPVDTPPSITPVTGTSDTILNNLDQQDADKLKEELKG
jgi:hypothetical protein|tara:strand:- start:84 stop:311 length:228 start_codon:yes stop_codon:yes gene_type:complete